MGCCPRSNRRRRCRSPRPDATVNAPRCCRQTRSWRRRPRCIAGRCEFPFVPWWCAEARTFHPKFANPGSHACRMRGLGAPIDPATAMNPERPCPLPRIVLETRPRSRACAAWILSCPAIATRPNLARRPSETNLRDASIRRRVPATRSGQIRGRSPPQPRAHGEVRGSRTP